MAGALLLLTSQVLDKSKQQGRLESDGIQTSQSFASNARSVSAYCPSETSAHKKSVLAHVFLSTH